MSFKASKGWFERFLRRNPGVSNFVKKNKSRKLLNMNDNVIKLEGEQNILRFPVEGA